MNAHVDKFRQAHAINDMGPADLIQTEHAHRAINVIDQLVAARKFRNAIKSQLRTGELICAMCCREMSPEEMYIGDDGEEPGILVWSDLSRVQRSLFLTSSELLKTPEFPLDSLTKTQLACMTTVSSLILFIFNRATRNVTVRVCTECTTDVSRSKVPTHSLVRIDPGPLPSHLPPLTFLEEEIIAPLRVKRYVSMIGPYKKQQWNDYSGHSWPTDSPQNRAYFDQLRAHVTAFKSSAVKDLPAMLYPLPADELPNLINVVLISPAKDLEGIRSLARRSPMLKVRGDVVVQWCLHLQEIYRTKFDTSDTHPHISETALSYYRSLGNSVPEPSVENAVCTSTVEEAEQVLGFYHKQTDGYTNNPEPENDDSVANPELPQPLSCKA